MCYYLNVHFHGQRFNVQRQILLHYREISFSNIDENTHGLDLGIFAFFLRPSREIPGIRLVQIPRVKTPDRLRCVVWHLAYISPQYGTCFMLL